MRHIIPFLIFTLFLISCGQNNTKQKELELKEKELALKERELDLKEKGETDTTKVKNSIKSKQELNDEDFAGNENANQSLSGVWTGCKDKTEKLILKKNGEGYIIERVISKDEGIGAGGVQLKKRKDGSYYDPVVGFSIKYDKTKNSLFFDIRQADINGPILLEYCNKVSEDVYAKSDKNSDINITGSWKDCDGMNYGFQLKKQGESYSMHRIKDYFVPIECTFKKKGDLFIGCDGDAEIKYDKLKKRIVYWDAGGNGAEYCRID